MAVAKLHFAFVLFLEIGFEWLNWYGTKQWKIAVFDISNIIKLFAWVCYKLLNMLEAAIHTLDELQRLPDVSQQQSISEARGKSWISWPVQYWTCYQKIVSIYTSFHQAINGVLNKTRGSTPLDRTINSVRPGRGM